MTGDTYHDANPAGRPPPPEELTERFLGRGPGVLERLAVRFPEPPRAGRADRAPTIEPAPISTLPAADVPLALALDSLCEVVTSGPLELAASATVRNGLREVRDLTLEMRLHLSSESSNDQVLTSSFRRLEREGVQLAAAIDADPSIAQPPLIEELVDAIETAFTNRAKGAGQLLGDRRERAQQALRGVGRDVDRAEAAIHAGTVGVAGPALAEVLDTLRRVSAPAQVDGLPAGAERGSGPGVLDALILVSETLDSKELKHDRKVLGADPEASKLVTALLDRVEPTRDDVALLLVTAARQLIDHLDASFWTYVAKIDDAFPIKDPDPLDHKLGKTTLRDALRRIDGAITALDLASQTATDTVPVDGLMLKQAQEEAWKKASEPGGALAFAADEYEALMAARRPVAEALGA